MECNWRSGNRINNRMRKKMNKLKYRRPAGLPALALLAGLQMVAAPLCHAIAISWTAETNTNLWDAVEAPVGQPSYNNWSETSLPAAGDRVDFYEGNLIHPKTTIDLNGNRTVESVALRGGLPFTLGTGVGAGTLTVGAGTLLENISIASYAYYGPVAHVINCNIAMNDTSGDGTFTMYMDADHEILVNGVVSGTNALRKIQYGTLILNNANTYSGGTIVADGILRVTNATGSATGTGAVTVQTTSGAILSGTGRIGGAITVETNGTIAPGNSIGTLTALSGVTLNGTYACEMGGTSADRLTVTGTLDVRNGRLDLSETAALTGTSYTIATASQVQWPFATVTGLPSGYSIVYSDTSIVIRPTQTFHVDALASAGGDGASWLTALDTLDEALSLVGWGEEIWVKVGVYFPGEGSTDPYSTFDVPHGVQLLGGFAGTETSASERAPAAYPTVLSGDLGNDDTNKVNGITTSPANIVGTNAYSVVTVSFAAPVVDGFTITGGRAPVTPIGNPGGESRGGGVFIDTDNVRIPTLSNCRLYGNTAVQGGAVFVHSYGGANIVSCDFRSNSSSDRGGAAYYWWSNVTTKNCNFSGNYAGNDGGAIYDDPQDKGTSLLVNCTITGNHAFDSGGAVQANTTGSSSAQMINTLIWNNSAGRAPTINNLIFYTFSHCLLQNNDLTGLGTGNLDGTDAANNPGFFLPLDPALAPSMDGDFRPSPDAAVLDAGDNSAISGIPLDLSGEPRILEGDGNSFIRVDLGAYEGPLYSAYSWWIIGYFPGETDPAIIGPAADPGGNGLNNALSFVTNTSPLSTQPVQPFAGWTNGDDQWFGIMEGNFGWEEFETYLEYSFDLENFQRVLLDPAGTIMANVAIEPGIKFSQGMFFIGALGADRTIHPKFFVRLGVDIPSE